MTQFSYGTYDHAENEVRVVRYRTAHEYVGNRNQALANVITIHLEGELLADPAAGDKHVDVVNKMNALRTAYASDNQDITFAGNSSNTIFEILNADTLTGTKVLYVDDLDKSGADYAVCKNYQIGLQADISLNDPTDPRYQIAYFEESLRRDGDYNTFRIPVISLPGVMIWHEYIQNMPVRVIQQGKITGYLGYPSHVPFPTYAPEYEIPQLRYMKKHSPRRIGGRGSSGLFGSTLYTVEYRYVFVVPSFVNLPVNQDYPLSGLTTA